MSCQKEEVEKQNMPQEIGIKSTNIEEMQGNEYNNLKERGTKKEI